MTKVIKKILLTFTFLFSIISYCYGKVSTLTFTSSCGGSGTADDGVVWTVTSDAAESTYDATKGVHYGTGNKAVSYLQLATSLIEGNITKIVINASGASGTTAKLNVTVGGSTFDTQKSLTASATKYTLNGSASGNIIIRITQSSAKRALYCKSVEVTYSESKYTINFINNIGDDPTSITQETSGQVLSLPNATPSLECSKNGWIFYGWTGDEENLNNIIQGTLKPTKDTSLYAVYKINEDGNEDIIDTLTYSKTGLGYSGGGGYTSFEDATCNSSAVYNGHIYQFPKNSLNSYIQMRSDGSSSGIITTETGGKIRNIKVKWNASTANGRTVQIYTSDTAYTTPSSLYNLPVYKTYERIIKGTSDEVNLDGKNFFGIRSETGALYIDTIFITWSTGTYDYSTNPKCFSTEIKVAEWFKDSVKFDIGNYDSIHTYRENLVEKSCDSIRIKLTNENTEECIRWFNVPIFAGENEVVNDEKCDVVILKDSVLTIKNDIANKNVFVYPNGELIINNNKTYTVNSLTLRRDNDSVPSFLYKGTIDIKNGMFFEIRTDAEDWRWLTLPDSIRIGNISDDPKSIMKYYDGDARAHNGRNGWKVLEKDSVSGFGVIFGIDFDDSKKRIYRFELDTNILTNEKGNKTIPVKKFYIKGKPANDLGWNLVGNPYMSKYNVSAGFGSIFNVTDSLVKEIINGKWTGRWITEEKKLRYIVIPSNKQEQHIIDAGGYEQICLEDGYILKPFTPFFIQAKENGILTFYQGQRTSNAPYRNRQNETTETFLRINIGNLKTGCYISNNFSDQYEPGDDFESLYPIYQSINNYKLLYSAINDSVIENGITVFSPSGTIYLDEEKTNLSDFEEINIFYDGKWYNLLYGQTVEFNGGNFILQAKRRKSVESIATDVENPSGNKKIRKFIHNGNVYILKNNSIYNVLGEIAR